MTLDKYYAKRDFDKTPEPRGEVARPGARLSFVIQKHAASKLHYDFRLELDGTLKSWAIPRGPSLDPKEKRLAVHVEDHPVSYGSFEGTIPAHEYGGGEVIVWDRGSWTPVGDPAEGYRKGHLKFRLDGEKLSGGWALLRMRRPGSDKDNWLLVKERDEAAREGAEAEITERLPDSVLSGKGIGKPARAPRAKAGKAAAPARAEAVPRAAKRASPAKTGQGIKAPLPAMLEPQLATLTDRAPEGDNWLAEIKFDGYRALCRIDKGKAVFYTRAGNDWTAKWPDIAQAAAQLPADSAWLDGEVVALDEQGNVSFQMLQNMAQHRGRLAYYVFDLPYLNGYDLRAMQLSQRKELLRTLLEKADPAGPVRYSDHLQGKAADAFSHACMHGLEGIMVKRADAPYAATRSESWLKVKCQQRQEFVVGGYTDPAGKREKFGALLLGVFGDDGSLRYVGRVGTGFNADSLRALHKDFADLATDAPPFREPPKKRGAPGLHWLQPKLIAEVKFAQWTNDGLIRQGAFMGMRSDKQAREIRQERPVPVEEAEQHAREEAGDAAQTAATATRAKRGAGSAGSRKPAPDEAVVAGVRLSHATRILFSEARVTKLDLAHYYEDIADWILPHLEQRPLTLVRCPQGHHCFFQKHANETTAEGVGRIEVPTGGATATYMSAGTLPGLISLVQMGVLELHTWGAREGHLDRPDRMIFDLDPDAGLEWKNVVEGAQLVRSLLQDIGLTSFVKTTGGKGLHVVVPLAPRHTWDEVKAFSKAVAAQLEQVLPDRFIANMSKAKRGGRIFVDYLRNASEATAVAAYSTRAKPHAPVSTPLHWDELADRGLRSDRYTVLNLRQRLAGLKEDPWADYFRLKQEISTRMRSAFEA
ncbi:DNA ligase D [Noviherbaspirillum soli]|uniref:DNA ligase D n=1 Tax=Noviherbaspirillum soli TaxID=1064518 RepID=UPI00188AAC82|nr:DNA ligase D [Noviherbaspirillum soli]